LENVLPHNVLIISNKPPYPTVDGGCYAMAKFEQLIQHSCREIYYFALSTQKHPFHEVALPEPWVLDQNFFTEKIDTRIQNKHVLKYMAGSSIRASRFYSKPIEKKILDLIKEKKIDVVIFESIYAAVYMKAIRKVGDTKVFIRSHNIEHQIWEKHFEHMPRGMKRLAFRSETTRLANFEEHCLQLSDGNIFISENDEQWYNETLAGTNGIYIPVQMRSQYHEARKEKKNLQLFHIGAMDWLPNVEGIKKFIEHIFPEIIEKYPAIELHLAGKAMPASFNEYKSSNIFIHGQVENAEAFIAKFDVLIVPIESGSGIRIKVLEAMAAGKPVISTATGISGIHAENKKEFLLADDTDSWIRAIEYLSDPLQYQYISNEAIDLLERSYSEKALLTQLIPFIKKQIAQND
jgi:glycosyltransferase involved in cell wall biosynthesis